MKYKEYPIPTEPGWYWAQESWWDEPEIVRVRHRIGDQYEVLVVNCQAVLDMDRFTWYSERLPNLNEEGEIAEEKIAEEKIAYPWDDVPAWAEWAATNANGDVYFYDEEPRLNVVGWKVMGFRYPLFYKNITGFMGDWTQSKQRRPR